MRQNDRVQAVAAASSPLEAFDRAKELTLGDFFEDPHGAGGQPWPEKMIRCEAAAREAIDGLCQKYGPDRLPVLQAVAMTVARLTAVELARPEDAEAVL